MLYTWLLKRKIWEENLVLQTKEKAFLEDNQGLEIGLSIFSLECTVSPISTHGILGIENRVSLCSIP